MSRFCRKFCDLYASIYGTHSLTDIIHHELLYKLYNSTMLFLSVYILRLDTLWKVCAAVDRLIVVLTQVISHWSCYNGCMERAGTAARGPIKQYSHSL